MLIVVEDGDVEGLLEALFDLEALGRADVLEVDAAEGGRDHLAEADDLLRILGVDLDVEDVDVCEALEEDALAFHDRLAGECADVAETEDGGAVREHGDEIAPSRVFVGVFRVLLDREAGRGHARGVGQRKIVRGHAFLGRNDLDLTGAALRVIFEGVVIQAHNGVLCFSPGLLGDRSWLRRAGSRESRGGGGWRLGVVSWGASRGHACRSLGALLETGTDPGTRSASALHQPSGQLAQRERVGGMIKRQRGRASGCREIFSFFCIG